MRKFSWKIKIYHQKSGKERLILFRILAEILGHNSYKVLSQKLISNEKMLTDLEVNFHTGKIIFMHFRNPHKILGL